MNARTMKGAQPKIDTSLLEQGIKNIRLVQGLIADSKNDAEQMLADCKEALQKDPLNVELQSQVLRLNDYIIKSTQNGFSLEGQIEEINRQLKAAEGMKPIN